MTADIPHIHVPQNATPSGRGAGGMRFGASEKADSLFHAAQRHSVRVRVLKTALPVAAIALAAVFSWYTFLATPASPVKVEVNTGGETGKLVMKSPHLNGYTKDNRPYSMTAAKATQDVKNSGAITLEGISRACRWVKRVMPRSRPHPVFMIMPMVVCNLIRTLLLPLTMVCVRNSILRMSI